ncbi:HIT family protein [Sphingomonas sp. BIUV-7]|uniref:HIT family protein n=1 Tax=Sphingomonas natans TaxID=3063330 RepID=A0ABT8YAQ4_9SPHN|nr:HIT family protein [Sphingomonas sp. BIUV-7]MDO6414913.1 HIT family protein [Sphingomonas sp. BIUV-7]
MVAAAVNATIARFGYPATLVGESGHWVVLLRPEQPTLGSLVLAAKSEATAFADLPPAAFAELHAIVGRIEAMLHRTVAPQKINYLMLMMVDPHVHFHVLPRHEGERTFLDMRKADDGWPKAPALGAALALTGEQIESLGAWLSAHW